VPLPPIHATRHGNSLLFTFSLMKVWFLLLVSSKCGSTKDVHIVCVCAREFVVSDREREREVWFDGARERHGHQRERVCCEKEDGLRKIFV
jgi:hypothetical protein